MLLTSVSTQLVELEGDLQSKQSKVWIEAASTSFSFVPAEPYLLKLCALRLETKALIISYQYVVPVVSQ